MPGRKISMAAFVSCAVVCTVVASQLCGCKPENKPAVPPPAATGAATDTSVAEGESLFNRFCVQCHGTRGNGRGSRKGPSLQTPAFRYGRTAEEIRRSIHDGRPGGMPAFSHVVDQRQLDALTAYILQLKP